MFLNCLREAIMFWIITFIIMLVFFALFGAFCSLLFTGYKGYSIYQNKFKTKSDKEEEEKEKNQNEGGQEEEF